MSVNYRTLAENIVRASLHTREVIKPTPECVIVRWRRNYYIANLQAMYPEYSKEIVLLHLRPSSVDINVLDEIRKLEAARGLYAELTADDGLEMNGRSYLRRLDDRLLEMTLEQATYVAKHPPRVYTR